MAIKPTYHSQGVGKLLIKSIEAELVKRGTKVLQVKTLGESHPDLNYAKTRCFYRRVGFLPLEENSLWGDENPCLMMVKLI